MSEQPSRSDFLAEAQAAWADHAPARELDKARVVFPYYIASTYAQAYGISLSNARTHLRALYEDKKAGFTRRAYRFAGQRQPEYVYWPAGVPAPDDEPGPSAP